MGVTESLENLFSDLEGVSDSASAQQAPPPQQLKESVLIRLANRIKVGEKCNGYYSKSILYRMQTTLHSFLTFCLKPNYCAVSQTSRRKFKF